jgi:hypothetical protein
MPTFLYAHNFGAIKLQVFLVVEAVLISFAVWQFALTQIYGCCFQEGNNARIRGGGCSCSEIVPLKQVSNLSVALLFSVLPGKYNFSDPRATAVRDDEIFDSKTRLYSSSTTL